MSLESRPPPPAGGGVPDVRAALLDAGLQLWSTRGWAAADPETTAALAGVSAREFHTEFGSRDELLGEVHDDGVEARYAAIVSAVAAAPPSLAERIRACLEAIAADLESDPRRFVVLAEPFGNPALLARRRASTRAYASLIVSELLRLDDGHPDAYLSEVSAHFCLGGICELAFAWLDADTAVDRDVLVGHGTRLVEACLRV